MSVFNYFFPPAISETVDSDMISIPDDHVEDYVEDYVEDHVEDDKDLLISSLNNEIINLQKMNNILIRYKDEHTEQFFVFVQFSIVSIGITSGISIYAPPLLTITWLIVITSILTNFSIIRENAYMDEKEN